VIPAGGSLPLFPPIDGLDKFVGAWTNREATTTDEIPRRLLIGERRLLPREEDFACAQVTAALEELDRLRRVGIAGQGATELVA
jgi:hypothetical protein